MDDSLKKLGEMVRQKRTERGLGVNQFARLVKMSGSSISRFERGERSLSKKNLNTLCHYLGIELGYMWEFAKEKEPVTITCRRCLARQTVEL